ncbi:MAG: hypothetical protein A4E58_02358 [Syntrophorhabdus sp. PtaB.Bin006]|nr:MAG: hypothetical protein A4E58_02358 [Syntrophorhabdus sp. PtaB.Bin006]
MLDLVDLQVVEYPQQFPIKPAHIFAQRCLFENSTVNVKVALLCHEGPHLWAYGFPVSHCYARCNHCVIRVGRLHGEIDPLREIFSVKDGFAVIRPLLRKGNFLQVHTPKPFTFRNNNNTKHGSGGDGEESLYKRGQVDGVFSSLKRNEITVGPIEPEPVKEPVYNAGVFFGIDEKINGGMFYSGIKKETAFDYHRFAEKVFVLFIYFTDGRKPAPELYSARLYRNHIFFPVS